MLIPNLLMGLDEQSVIVIDPKGEAADYTANARRAMGHDVVILNPFDTRGLGSAGFNPLAALDPASPNFYDDAHGIGEALIKIEGNDPHWSESALGLIVALIMWEKKRNGDAANLDNVRAMLTQPDVRETQRDADGESYSRQTAGLRITAAHMLAEGGYEIESLIARFTETSRELSEHPIHSRHADPLAVIAAHVAGLTAGRPQLLRSYGTVPQRSTSSCLPNVCARTAHGCASSSFPR